MRALTKRVVREVPQITGRHGQPYIVELVPGGVVQVHEKGYREMGRMRVDGVFWKGIKEALGVAM